MDKNIGGVDKILRAILGLGIIGAGIFLQSWWGAVGVVLLLTSLMGWCPPYALLGINTCKTKQGWNAIKKSEKLSVF